MAGGGGITLGFLKFVLGLDSLSFDTGLDDAAKKLKAGQKKLEAVSEKMVGVGKNLTLGVTGPLAAFAAKGIAEARETAQAMGQVNAALTSMGGASGRTAEQLTKFADKMELSSLYEGDEILRKVTANMLTFGNISGATFDRAQQAAVDLATRMGTDLQSATLLVGKALNDPIKGMGALSKAGIQFTVDQKALIKSLVETGDAAGAQAIIMKELERQFGGSAAAAQNADPWNKATDAFKQMAETVGTALLPIIPVLTEAVVSVATAFQSVSPEMQKWIIIAGGVAAAIGPILIGVGGMISVFGQLLPLLTKLPALVGLVSKALIFLGANPVILGIAGTILGIYLAWKNWDKITAIVKGVYIGVKTWLVDKFGAIVEGVKAKVDAVTGFFKDMWDKVTRHSYVPDMVDDISYQMDRLGPEMVDKVKAATDEASAAFKNMAFLSTPEIITGETDTDAFKESLQVDLLEPTRSTTAEIAESFASMAQNVVGSLRNMVDSFKDGDILGGLQDMLSLVTEIIDLLGVVGVIKGATGAIGGARAFGGPVQSGKSYMVGERGPEWFTPKTSGYIHPNGAPGGQQVYVKVVPSEYFDVVVDDRSARVAAPMAHAARMGGAAGGYQAVVQKQRRTIP